MLTVNPVQGWQAAGLNCGQKAFPLETLIPEVLLVSWWHFSLEANSAEFYSCGEGTQQGHENALVVPPHFPEAQFPLSWRERSSLSSLMWEVLRNESL